MKIAVTCQDKNMNSPVESRFGRSRYFAVINTESGQCSFIENSNHNEMSGAGIKTAQMIVDNGVELLLTGRVGPKAKNVLDMAKIRVLTDVEGTLEDIMKNVNDYMEVL